MTNISPSFIESLEETRTDYLPKLLKILVNKGYSIVVMEDWENQIFLLVESDTIQGQIIEGKLYFDSKEMFDKPRKCCLQLPIPINQSQVNFILDKLNWLVTTEGKDYSDNFNFINTYDS
jgi:hypothetical protein